MPRALATVRNADATKNAISVWSDAWAVDPEVPSLTWTPCYLLSLVGAPLAVRGLHSAFVGGATVKLETPKQPEPIFPRPLYRAPYRTRWSRLPSGALHALLVADINSVSDQNAQDRLVLAPDDAALPGALFTDLLAHRGLMALPEWREWLLVELLETERAVRLAGPVAALRVTASEDEIDALIQAGLRRGAITFPSE